MILAGLLGAIVWDLITWYLGLPSSSSHALMGGYAGAAIAKAGFGALILERLDQADPLHRRLAAARHGHRAHADGRPLLAAVPERPPGPVDRVFRRLQLLSAALYSLSHGANDAQKTMGIIVGLLVASQDAFRRGDRLAQPLPPARTRTTFRSGSILAAHIAIALGTAMGGWRIVKTMGSRITKLRPFGGFCAETAGGITVLIATQLGVPVSTTHTITGAIVGVGAAQRLSAVRWGVAGRIVWAWILTIPMSAAIAAVATCVLVGKLPELSAAPRQPLFPSHRRLVVRHQPVVHLRPSRAPARSRAPPAASGAAGRRRSAGAPGPPRSPRRCPAPPARRCGRGSANSSTPPAAATSDGSPEPIASSSELPNVSVGEGKVKTSADA